MDSTDSHPISPTTCSRVSRLLESAATSASVNMLAFSRDQSSLISMSLDGQLDYTVVNSHVMSMLDKAPHRLEVGLMGPHTGAVFHEPPDELGNLIIFDRSYRSSGPNTLRKDTLFKPAERYSWFIAHGSTVVVLSRWQSHHHWHFRHTVGCPNFANEDLWAR